MIRMLEGVLCGCMVRMLKRGLCVGVCRNFSYWARVCPVQTTDGDDCGLVKNISLTGILSSKKSEEPVMEILREHGLQHLEEIIPSTLDRVDKVFVNGKWVGISYQAQELVDLLRSLRRKGDLFEEVSMRKPLM